MAISTKRRRGSSPSSSGFDGILRDPSSGRWKARLAAVGARHFLGTWDTARDAAIARDRAALHFALDVALNLDGNSRKAGPLSPAELRLEAHSRWKEQNRKSRYAGVIWVGASETWAAQVHLGGGRQATVCCSNGEEEAALIHDRMAVFVSGDRARLNFPERRVAPASPEQIRREQYATRASKMTSDYRGVVLTVEGRWSASIKAEGRVHSLGAWTEEEAAAVAYDRATLFFGAPSWRRNFPRRRLRAASPAQLRREQRALTKATRTSRYHGVAWIESQRKWRATVNRDGADHTVASCGDEEDAAMAHDRVALAWFGASAKLNFPRERVAAATPERLRKEMRAQYKETTTSRYHGVSWSSYTQSWRAAIQVDNRTYELGRFAVEVDAARAYDTAALRLRGKGPLNFPVRSRYGPKAWPNEKKKPTGSTGVGIPVSGNGPRLRGNARSARKTMRLT